MPASTLYSPRSKTLAQMISEEFEALLDTMQTEEAGELTTDEFFTALSALAETATPRETIELTATVKDGQLAFLEPSPLPARGNALLFGDRRVVINLVADGAGEAE
jgi:hypothetical protein